MHHLSHLCRPGRPIITPACKYWSTAPVCMCYFKMPRPVISMLMIVIAKATGSAWLFKACGYQWEAGRHKYKHAHARLGRGQAGVLMRVLWGSLGQIFRQDHFLLSVCHPQSSPTSSLFPRDCGMYVCAVAEERWRHMRPGALLDCMSPDQM